MQATNMPGFTAARSLERAQGRYRSAGRGGSGRNGVEPAIPACGNCDYILDNCARNGGRPRALCNACAFGNCYEDPPMPNPFPDPFGRFRW